MPEDPKPVRMRCPECGAKATAAPEKFFNPIKCPKCKKIRTWIRANEVVAQARESKKNHALEQRDAHPKNPLPTNPKTQPVDMIVDSPTPNAPALVNERARRLVPIGILAGGLLLLASPFLQWVRVMNGGLDGMQGDGKIFFALALAVLVALGMTVAEKLSPFWTGTASTGAGLFVVSWTVVFLWRFYSFMAANDSAFVATQLGVSAGIFIALAAGVCLSVCGVLVQGGSVNGIRKRRDIMIASFCVSVLAAVAVSNPLGDSIGLPGSAGAGEAAPGSGVSTASQQPRSVYRISDINFRVVDTTGNVAFYSWKAAVENTSVESLRTTVECVFLDSEKMELQRAHEYITLPGRTRQTVTGRTMMTMHLARQVQSVRIYVSGY